MLVFSWLPPVFLFVHSGTLASRVLLSFIRWVFLPQLMPSGHVPIDPSRDVSPRYLRFQCCWKWRLPTPAPKRSSLLLHSSVVWHGCFQHYSSFRHTPASSGFLAFLSFWSNGTCCLDLFLENLGELTHNISGKQTFDRPLNFFSCYRYSQVPNLYCPNFIFLPGIYLFIQLSCCWWYQFSLSSFIHFHRCLFPLYTLPLLM